MSKASQLPVSGSILRREYGNISELADCVESIVHEDEEEGGKVLMHSLEEVMSRREVTLLAMELLRRLSVQRAVREKTLNVFSAYAKHVGDGAKELQKIGG